MRARAWACGGAAQALAAGFGGLLGAALADILRIWADVPSAFGIVFLAEAGLFLLSAVIAIRVIDNTRGGRDAAPSALAVPGE